jgi:Tfp pilus assembly protein PilF
LNARSICERAGQRAFLSTVLVNLGTAYHRQGDFGKAEEILQRGLEKARATNSLKEEVYRSRALQTRKDTGDHRSALDTRTAALSDACRLRRLHPGLPDGRRGG